jgi:RNA ligase (TIGR02306 family)
LKGWFFYAWYRFLDLIGLGDPLRGKRQPGPDAPYFDIENFKNFAGTFLPGEDVVVTEKLHGSQAKFIFHKDKMYVGSRNLWKAPDSPCIWRKALRDNPWIEPWCREHEGHTLYGEVFPTQKFKDGSAFHYGIPEGKAGFRVFDILKPNREWCCWEEVCTDHDIPRQNWVPVLHIGGFNETEVKNLVDGKTKMLGASHIREGVVIKSEYEGERVHGLGRKHLKLVSSEYYEKS